MLWAISNQSPGLSKLFNHVVAGDGDITTGRQDIARQALESRRFACSVDPKQCETLAAIKTKTDVLDGQERLSKPFRIGLSKLQKSDNVRWIPRTIILFFYAVSLKFKSFLLGLHVFFHLWIFCPMRGCLSAAAEYSSFSDEYDQSGDESDEEHDDHVASQVLKRKRVDPVDEEGLFQGVRERRRVKQV